MTQETEYRLKRDSMGEFNVPVDAYYGANTMRAVVNFPISDLRFPRSFIRAIELLGGVKGSRTPVHPNDHVNAGQSSNDVIPTTIHIAALKAVHDELVPGLEKLSASLQVKADEFMDVVKTGRTHLQDATPIRLGQEFVGYVGQLDRAILRLREAESELGEVALGGAAAGTGVNGHPEFAPKVCAVLTQMLGVPVRETSIHFQAQNTLDNIVAASGALKTVAVSLMKISNDIRWLGSGPGLVLGRLRFPKFSRAARSCRERSTRSYPNRYARWQLRSSVMTRPSPSPDSQGTSRST